MVPIRRRLVRTIGPRVPPASRPMSMPRKTTFDLLAETQNGAAVDVLVAALDLADPAIQALAVEALLKRRPTRGIVELVRRFHFLSGPSRELVEKDGAFLGRDLRECLLSGDAAVRNNALDLICRFEDYSQLPTLVRLLEGENVRERGAVEHAVFKLANRLYEHLKFGKEGDEAGVFLRDAQRVRHQMLSTLESACHRYPVHRCRQVIEGLLILGDPDNMHLKNLFRDAAEEVRSAAAELLCSSRHPGVMGLVLDSMSQNYPFPAAFAAFERRTDPEFICHLLRNWPRKPGPFQQKNIKELRMAAWLEPERNCLDLVPAALHRMLIAFLMSTGLTQPQKLEVLEWMVHWGSADGRLAATDVLVDLEDDKVQEVVLESLESEEPDVQAWATGQLRTWAIPNAMELLVERLDSPMPEVRQAARSELAGFDIHRALELCEHLEPRLQVAVGKLLRKIDPQTIHKLKEQMLSAIRRKRIRAARAALAMRLHLDVADSLMIMARDSDNLVRRTAAEVLGNVGTRESAAMLLELTHDDSPRVREAANAALDAMLALRGAPAAP